MAYSERIKNFARIRDIMRQFYVYGLFATAAASPEEMRQSAFLAYAIQEREDHGQIAAVADIFDERGAAAADDE